MLDRRLIIVPILLASQWILVSWASGTEHPPAMPDLNRFPAQVGDWKQFREDPIEADVKGVLHADQLLSRTYLDNGSHTMTGLFVAWFQSQRGGLSQPHSPKVCLPGSGWTPEETGEITLDTAAGPITINRYRVVNHSLQSLVFYWYQTPKRVIASEWAAKFWLVPDTFQDHRTDSALVRITTALSGAHDQVAENAAKTFARQAFPLLRERLPR